VSIGTKRTQWRELALFQTIDLPTDYFPNRVDMHEEDDYAKRNNH
jgi:hypothetical protein